ncbi:MAG: hypothetical protein HZA54_04325 [Planctomycetes bacterium]|nr:hypothetical protein [Planctomycetota bacterium]
MARTELTVARPVGAILALVLLAAVAPAAAAEETLLKGEFSLTSGLSDEAFDQDQGYFVRAEIDLPLRRFSGFGLLGQVGISYSHSDTDYDTITTALLGTLTDQNVALATLAIDAGFKLRYDELGGPDGMLRPFVETGLSIPVYIADADHIVAGQVPEAPELRESGVPTGWGNIRVGAYLGGGVELCVGAGLVLALDVRHHFIGGKNSDFTHYGVTVGLDF